MITIKNHTERSIIAYNNSYSVKIPFGKSVNIKEDDLKNDFVLNFKYVFFEEGKDEIDYGIEQGGLRKSVYAYVEYKSIFPIITTVDVTDIKDLTLDADDVKLRMLLIFKTVTLKRIACKVNGITCSNIKNMFLNSKDKKRFTKLMRNSCMFTTPIAFILLIYGISVVFDNSDFIEKATVMFFILCIAAVSFMDLYYAIVTKKWSAFTGD